MLKLPLPNPKLKLNELTLANVLAKDSLFSTFPIHAVHLFIPGSDTLVKSCEEALSLIDDTYFLVKKISLSSLISPVFIDQFVNKGILYAFSHGLIPENDNFITLLPSGNLILSLEAAIADTLSIEKEKSGFKSKKHKPSFQKYAIDLKSPKFLPGKKLYDTTLSELKKLDYLSFDLLLRWDPSGNICPQSIRKYFEDQGIECLACEPSQSLTRSVFVPVPLLDFSSFDEVMAEDFVEWIGTKICELEYSKSTEDSFLNTFPIPEPSIVLSTLQTVSYEGFLIQRHIHNLLKEVMKMFNVETNLPFVAISISGYQDCYDTSNGNQKFSSKDKITLLIVSPSLQCWLIFLNN